MAKDKVIPSNLVLCNEKFKYDNIEQMVSDTGLQLDNVVELLGYYKAGDGAGHKRVIADSDDGSGVQLDNGLYANIVHSGIIHSNWFGANKNGDVTDIFKKIVAYNKPTIIDYGTYTITDYIFMEDNTILEDNGTYMDKHIIRSLSISENLPNRELVGIFNLADIGERLIDYGGMQGFCYDTKRKHYIIGFAGDTPSGTIKTTIAIYDENFNFVKKSSEYSFGHGDGLVYLPDTDEVLISDQPNAKIAVLNPETLIKIREIDLGHATSTMFYNPELKIIGVVSSREKLDLYDVNFKLIKNVTLETLSTMSTYQMSGFFKGYYVILGQEDTNGADTGAGTQHTLFFFNLQGKLIKIYRYHVDLNSEPEGLVMLDDNTLLMSDYDFSKQFARLYKLDFKSHTHNFADIIENSTQEIINANRVAIYVDSNAVYEGNGTKNSPFKTLQYAIMKCKRFSFMPITLYLKGEFNEEGIKIGNFPKIFITSTDINNKAIISTPIFIQGSFWYEFWKVDFNKKTSSVLITADGATGKISECNFREDSSVKGTMIVCNRGIHRINTCVFENVGACTSATMAQLILGNNTYNNCNKRYSVEGSLVQLYSMSSQGLQPDSSSNSQIFGQTSVVSLNTPYYTYKMEQEGVLSDFYAYMDEKVEYDAQIQAEEQAKYKAYELLLQENPNLTWEEFLMSCPTTITSLEEPVIPETVQAFMEKYLGVKATQQSKINYTSDQNTFQKW